MGIVIKNSLEISKMVEAGRIVAGVLDAIEVACVPGVTTAELERIARRELERTKAKSAFLGYRQAGTPPFPAVLCTSVNQQVVHGIPSDRVVLGEGDVIGIDFACFKDGYCGDAARTIAVGVISEPTRALIDSTRAALDAAIAECMPGKRLGDVGAAVEALATARGYSVVRDFVGHGIGRAMHEAPQVPNYGNRGSGLRLKAGMVIAIEPMLNTGRGEVRVLSDGWTVETRDSGLSAHMEHTVAITHDGPRVLTA